jgi:uncharacterized damage-inducible protein DinB
MLSQSIASRLIGQLDALAFVLGGAREESLRLRPSPEKWSAHENLAHLARHHEVFLDRLERMLAEDRPALPRYRAEEDAEWPALAERPTSEVRERLTQLRSRLIDTLRGLSDEQLARTGVHPLFGEMTIPMWMEFFLLHEAHHLYVILGRARG